MKRRLFRILIRSLTVLSLLLCVATCVLFWCSEGIYYFGRRPQWVLSTVRPHFALYRNYDRLLAVDARWLLLSTLAVPTAWVMHDRYLRIRAAICHDRALRQRLSGRCPSCGYDLRATPDRCPECGAVPASTSIKGKQAGKPAPQPPQAGKPAPQLKPPLS